MEDKYIKRPSILNKLKSLSDPQYFVKEESRKGVMYRYWFREVPNPFFSDLWNYEYDEILKEFIYYCGEEFSYAFSYFCEIFKDYIVDYFIDFYTKDSSKTIKAYFLKNKEEIFDPKFDKYPKTWKTVFRDLPPNPKKVYDIFHWGFRRTFA